MNKADELILQGANEALAHARGWMPIETAPKDGTEILLFLSRGDIISGSYCDGVGLEGGIDEWGWIDNHTSTQVYEDSLPTHWMPLPEPPEDKC